MTKSKILLRLKLIPAWRNARQAQPSSSWGCPAWRRGQAEEHGPTLAQTWPPLTRGCCCCLLGPEFCLPGAAGERAGLGTGSACPGFCGHPKAAKRGQQLAEGCRGAGLVLGGCLGEPMAILGSWASSAGEAPALTDHSLQVLLLLLGAAPTLLLRERCSPATTQIQDPQQETLPWIKPFLQFKGSFAGEGKISWKVSHNVIKRARRRNVQPQQSSSGAAGMCFVLAPLVPAELQPQGKCTELPSLRGGGSDQEFIHL